MSFRVGLGYDVHRLAEGETLWLGGVLVPHSKGTVAHSDGDVLTHALIDALLGALGLGDIGRHFPDTDTQFKGCDSLGLLSSCLEKMRAANFRIVNADLTLVAQAPKFAPHIDAMKKNIAEACQCDEDQINIKATTTEGMGFEGRKEGIAAMAIILLQAHTD